MRQKNYGEKPVLNLTSKLVIDGTEVKGMSGAKLVSSIDACMDTATIVIAAGGAKPTQFKEDQRVELYLGYGRYGLVNEFSGIVTAISPKAPVELQCADDFYLLRRETVRRDFYQKQLSDVIKQVAKGYEVVADVNAYQMKVTTSCPGKTARWFIAKCAKDYGFLAFFREKKLFFVKPEYLETDEGSVAEYQEGVNMYDDHLYYHRTETVGKVTVYSESANGYLVKGSYGKGKNEKTVHIEGIGASECWKRAKEIYDELNYQGFKGDFSSFGYPFVRCGAYCSVASNDGEKSGVFRCDKVETDFGTSGFRRVITVGQKHPSKQPIKKMTGQKIL
jgi:hypothetical protein